MGKAALPAGLKILRGRGKGLDGRARDSGGRAIDPSPNFKRIAPEKPAGLSEKAAEHWDEVVPDLQRLSLLAPSQIGALVILCEVWARIVRARALLGADVVSKSSQGMRQSPVLIALRADEKLYLVIATHFGLTPSAESQLRPRDATDPDEESPFV